MNCRIYLRHYLWYLDIEFHPVSLLLKSEGFEMFLIVWEIIDSSGGGEFIKALYKHSFMVHIRETHRSLDTVHSFGSAPLFH